MNLWDHLHHPVEHLEPPTDAQLVVSDPPANLADYGKAHYEAVPKDLEFRRFPPMDGSSDRVQVRFPVRAIQIVNLTDVGLQFVDATGIFNFVQAPFSTFTFPVPEEQGFLLQALGTKTLGSCWVTFYSETKDVSGDIPTGGTSTPQDVTAVGAANVNYGSFNVTSAAGLVLPQRSSRAGLSLLAPNGAVSVGSSAGLTLVNGFPISAGQPFNPTFKGPLYAIAAANTTLYYWEEYN